MPGSAPGPNCYPNLDEQRQMLTTGNRAERFSVHGPNNETENPTVSSLWGASHDGRKILAIEGHVATEPQSMSANEQAMPQPLYGLICECVGLSPSLSAIAMRCTNTGTNTATKTCLEVPCLPHALNLPHSSAHNHTITGAFETSNGAHGAGPPMPPMTSPASRQSQ